MLEHFDEHAAHKTPSNPRTLNCRDLSWEQEYMFNNKDMCNPVSHNIRCYEGPFLHKIDLGLCQMSNLGKYRGDLGG